MKAGDVHLKLLWVLLSLTLTCAPLDAFPAPKSRAEAVAGLGQPDPAARAEAVVWLAENGRMADQPLLILRLRDEDEGVRGYAEQALWLLWGRSCAAALDRLIADGVEQMQAGPFKEAARPLRQNNPPQPPPAQG